VRFALLIHVSELGRASNTGKLLSSVLPDGCDVFLHGVPADVERLDALVKACKGNAFILYPSADAVPVAAMVESSLMISDEPSLPQHEQSPSSLLVVLIDGTWHQAKRMHKTLTGIPHVALAPEGQISQFSWRRQSESGRVTTAEAAALLLEELARHCPHPEVDGRLSAEALREALALLDGALQQQSHYSKVNPPVQRNPRTEESVARKNLEHLPLDELVCKHYAKGHCRFGDTCSFVHPPVI